MGQSFSGSEEEMKVREHQAAGFPGLRAGGFRADLGGRERT